MARVLLSHPLADPAAQARLAESVEVVLDSGGDPAGFRARLADADAVVIRPPTRLSAADLDAAPALRVIFNLGSGVDHIDVDAARARGIAVLAGAGSNAHAVAEYVLSTIVATHRRLYRAAAHIRADGLDWGARIGFLRGHEVGGTVLGIVGYGHIGRDVAKMARHGLGLRTVIYDPYVQAGPGDVDQQCASLAELLSLSRTVTLHVPLTDETRSMIGAAELALLSADAVLINSSRGGVVDEDALFEALRAGRLWAAALDVYADEPPSPDRLRELAAVPDLILTPHIAGITNEAGAALSARAVDAVLAALLTP
jgi:(S)-sulfolactate dehydrogenase